MPPKAAKKEEKAHKLPELGQENYDVLEMHVKHCFYAADWLGMYEASQVPPDADAGDIKTVLNVHFPQSATELTPGVPGPLPNSDTDTDGQVRCIRVRL